MHRSRTIRPQRSRPSTQGDPKMKNRRNALTAVVAHRRARRGRPVRPRRLCRQRRRLEPVLRRPGLRRQCRAAGLRWLLRRALSTLLSSGGRRAARVLPARTGRISARRRRAAPGVLRAGPGGVRTARLRAGPPGTAALRRVRRLRRLRPLTIDAGGPSCGSARRHLDTSQAPVHNPATWRPAGAALHRKPRPRPCEGGAILPLCGPEGAM